MHPPNGTLLSRLGRFLGLGCFKLDWLPSRTHRLFTSDKDGIRFATPEVEPLKTACALSPVFRKEHSEVAFPEPAIIRGIERRSIFHRLDAAVTADVHLFQMSQRYRRNGADADSVRPDLAETLALSLTVWAWTRSRLGLEDDATVAMNKALEWVDGGSASLRGYVNQRSARTQFDQLSDSKAARKDHIFFATAFTFPDIIHELDAARKEHKKTKNGEAAVTEATLDLGTAFTTLHQPEPGHDLLYLGLNSLEARENFDVIRQLDARSVLARSYLRLDEVEKAEIVARPIDADRLEPRDRYLWLHLQADLQRAAERREPAFGRRLEALALGLDHCGPERVLDDLAALGRDRPESSRLFQEASTWVAEAAHYLADRVNDDRWRDDIGQLAKAVLSGSEPEGGWEPVELQKQLYRTLRQELTFKQDEDDGGFDL